MAVYGINFAYPRIKTLVSKGIHLRIKSFLLLLLMANVVLVLAPQRLRGAADVVQTTYSVGTLGGSYDGDATFVMSSSGNINGFIDLWLVAGTPVAEATDRNIVAPT